MDERPEGTVEIVTVGDPDAPRRGPPRWATALAVAALALAVVPAAPRLLGGDGPAGDGPAGEKPTATPAPVRPPVYVTSGLPPPYDVHGPREDDTPPRQRALVGLPDGSYAVSGRDPDERHRFGGEVVGGLDGGTRFVVFNGEEVAVTPAQPGGPARTLIRTSWYVGAMTDRVYVALRAARGPVVRVLRGDGGRAAPDTPLPAGSLEPGGWHPRALVGSAPTVVVERITSRPGTGREIGVLRPGGKVEVVARDAYLAGVTDALVLTRRQVFDEASLGVTRVTAGGLERHELALPGGWLLAPEAAVVNAAGVMAFPVYAAVDSKVTAVAYAAVTDRVAWLVPGSYGVAAQAGLASDARHLVFAVETPSGLRPAVWHPPGEPTARYLAGRVPASGRFACRPDPQPCGYAVWPRPLGSGVPNPRYQSSGWRSL